MDERDGVAAEADETGGATEEALVVLTTAKEEAVDDVGGGDSETLTTEVANREGLVTILNAIYACL